MAVSPTIDEGFDHCEIGDMVVLVISLLRSPAEDVEREIRI